MIAGYAYARTRRRTIAVWPIAGAFVAGLIGGLWWGQGVGWRTHEAADLAWRTKAIHTCYLRGAISTVTRTEHGDLESCAGGSNRMGAKNGD